MPESLTYRGLRVRVDGRAGTRIKRMFLGTQEKVETT
jgi:hypothetical protein